jgi:hypothetical protein
MDSDDICFVERLERQVKFLDERDDVGVVGTGFKVIDEEGKVVTTHTEPSEPTLSRWRLLFGNIVAHPSVMARTRILRKLGGYDTDVYVGEDYDLWMRAADLTGIVILPDVLLGLRKHAYSTSSIYQEDDLRTGVNMSKRAIEAVIGYEIPVETIRTLLLYPASRPRNVWHAANVLHVLRKRYVRAGGLSREEEMNIRADAAKRMQLLFLQTLRNQSFFPLKIMYKLIAKARMLLVR